MKKFLLIISIFNIQLFNIVFAQQIRCSTMEHLEFLKQSDPFIEENMRIIEEHTQKFIAKEGGGEKAIYTIPVVVHVVYNMSSQNISTTQIQSQITVLNEDFRRLNADKSYTPSTFSSIAADAEINFCLATVDPNGNATSGIVRKSTTVTSFSDNDAVKYSSSGGSNAWPRDKYLNLWVCNLGGGLLGYAQFPGGTAATDGVVINYKYFGRNGSALAPYNKGRTATHEVGHWLNLRHIWGDAYCGTDYVTDTPTQQQDNYGCPTHPKSNSCGTSAEMFMNYMDYTDDACMNTFSLGQKSRMRALFASGGARAALLTSNGCGTSSGGTGGGGTPTTATITVGSGTSVTANAPYGTYYMDERSQFIITKSELVSAGWTSTNSYLKSLAFNVYTASSQTMNSFTVKIRHTTATTFGTSTSFLSTSGMTTVYSGSVVASAGWKTHTFSTSFAYNGTDNLLVDICWNNSSYTTDSKVYYTSTGDYKMLYKKADVSSGDVCANTTGTLSYYRPNMRFVFSSAALKLEGESEDALMGIIEENIFVEKEFSIYPNPATDKLNLVFNIDEENSTAEISVFNILGETVAKLNMENLQTGQQLFVLDFNSDTRFSNVKSGIYFCSVNVNGKNLTEKFVIAK